MPLGLFSLTGALSERASFFFYLTLSLLQPQQGQEQDLRNFDYMVLR